jgi:hypothetical protein
MRKPLASVVDLGDLIIVLLTGTLAGLHHRLADDGFDNAADLVADLIELADDYTRRATSGKRPRSD